LSLIFIKGREVDGENIVQKPKEQRIKDSVGRCNPLSTSA